MTSTAFTLRHELRPGDIGWVVHRHGVLYAREYGWDYRFEAYVAETIVPFGLHHDPARERLWLAEIGERIVGSIAIVSGQADAAQLRWFLVEPDSRGMGIGRRLIDETLAFCRATGRRRVYLLTVTGLDAAAHLYTAAGFRLTEQIPAARWGAEVVEERYDLTL
ncbi:MAG TPA: GNAT family N-acetyltransferase [Longimicrobiales bacterium]|nr:GNAT family N-acetyltransferase [Longimicrobiales bacterium]